MKPGKVAAKVVKANSAISRRDALALAGSGLFLFFSAEAVAGARAGGEDPRAADLPHRSQRLPAHRAGWQGDRIGGQDRDGARLPDRPGATDRR